MGSGHCWLCFLWSRCSLTSTWPRARKQSNKRLGTARASDLLGCFGAGEKGVMGPRGDFLRVTPEGRHRKSSAGVNGTPNEGSLLCSVMAKVELTAVCNIVEPPTSRPLNTSSVYPAKLPVGRGSTVVNTAVRHASPPPSGLCTVIEPLIPSLHASLLRRLPVQALVCSRYCGSTSLQIAVGQP